AGRPMVRWSVGACREATGTEPYLIVPPDGAAIGGAAGGSLKLVEQADPLGTGHALLQAAEALDGNSDLILVVNADMPLLRAGTLRSLVEAQSKNAGVVTLLTTNSEQSRGFGRVVRDKAGGVVAIVEEAQASPDELQLTELNVGAYCFDSKWLWNVLADLSKSPKGEYYLTDVVGLAAERGDGIGANRVSDADETIGVNTMEHLAQAEAAARRRINRKWMQAGVRMIDPDTTYIDAEVSVGPGTVLLPNTHLGGQTIVGGNCKIGPSSILRDAQVGDGCAIEASVVDQAVLEAGVDVGPFARLRPGTKLGPGVHVGNFGEIKDSTLGAGVKVGHFSYIGDATIGENVNIGAGTITCNYDGKHKSATIIGKGAFIGSDTMLVAPVTIGVGARTGAGAVVTKDVPDRTLAAGVPARVIRKLDPDD
ncbi:MAG: bifunctional UDP-N-acetylglucosamine diphosphorylase/glucosamine-1-phosphate N-acetyltransferase GlmU, partial [Chloroflexi bacterium]|nr:bifunctional UDP-N-acetylglucosamine diphosphorylase/glucosamine-1-phosphate N-acetyltransferase GlmU [Chloroflexota bacterium]